MHDKKGISFATGVKDIIQAILFSLISISISISIRSCVRVRIFSIFFFSIFLSFFLYWSRSVACRQPSLVLAMRVYFFSFTWFATFFSSIVLVRAHFFLCRFHFAYCCSNIATAPIPPTTRSLARSHSTDRSVAWHVLVSVHEAFVFGFLLSFKQQRREKMDSNGKK